MEANKTNLLYAVGLGLIASDLIPTPADGLYFYTMRNNKEKLNDGIITPKKYWVRDAVGYYGYNALWWGSVLGASYFLGKNFTQKRNILLGLIAGGIVFSVLSKNIKKDEIYYANKNNELK